MGRDAQEIDPEVINRKWFRAECLNCVCMENSAVTLDSRAKGPDVLDGAQFIVRVHEAYEKYVIRHQRFNVPVNALSIDRNKSDLKPERL